MHENKRFSRHGFNFNFEITTLNSRTKQKQHLGKTGVLNDFFVKRQSDGQRTLTLSILSLNERKKLPFEIVKIIQEYYCMVTKLEDHEEKDYNDFMNYFSIEIIPAAKINKMHNNSNVMVGSDTRFLVHLRVDVREILVRLLNKFTHTPKYMSLIIWCAALLQSLIPWVIAIVINPLGFGDLDAANLGRAAYKKFVAKTNGIGNNVTTSTYSSIANYDCAQFNSSNFPVIEGIKYSIAGEDPFWQDATVFMTITSTLLHLFYAHVIYAWLATGIADYRRRHETLLALDDLIKKRHFYDREFLPKTFKIRKKDEQNSIKSKIRSFDSISSTPTPLSFNSDNSDEREDASLRTQLDDNIGSKVIVKCTKPLLLFDSPENVYNFCKARNVLKEIGVMYHIRLQVLAFCLLLGFFTCMIAMVYVMVVLNFQVSPVLIATATLLFLFGTMGVLEMVHQGANANYQISRCLTNIDDQCLTLLEEKEKYGELHLERTEATAFAIAACRDELRIEWERHPVRIFFLPAGNIIYRIIVTLMVTLIGFIIQWLMAK
jgi:hypothetical protein